MKARRLIAITYITLSLALATGCVSQIATPLPEGYEGRTVWVVPNEHVRMADFGPRLIRELNSRGFNAHLASGIFGHGTTNDLMVTYTASRTFNLTTCYPHLSYAKIRILDSNGNDVAIGTFRQRGGPFSLAFSTLMRHARTKMRPVFAEMFTNYPRKTDEEF